MVAEIVMMSPMKDRDILDRIASGGLEAMQHLLELLGAEKSALQIAEHLRKPGSAPSPKG